MSDRVSGSGILFVVSAPSGTGKSTACHGVRACLSGLGFSVSHTTRAPRDAERDGEHYHFVDHAKFQAMIDGHKPATTHAPNGAPHATTGALTHQYGRASPTV